MSSEGGSLRPNMGMVGVVHKTGIRDIWCYCVEIN